MLFRVISGKPVRELNPEIEAIAEFVDLTERQLLYVILSTDYKSPFRKLSPTDKKERAALEAGYKLEKDGKRLDMNGRNVVNGKNEKVEKAIKKYRILQRDEDYENVLGLSKLIGDIRAFNVKPEKTAQEIEKAIKFSKDLPALIKAKKEIEDTLEMYEDEITDVVSVAPVEEEVQKETMSILATINEEEDDV